VTKERRKENPGMQNGEPKEAKKGNKSESRGKSKRLKKTKETKTNRDLYMRFGHGKNEAHSTDPTKEKNAVRRTAIFK